MFVSHYFSFHWRHHVNWLISCVITEVMRSPMGVIRNENFHSSYSWKCSLRRGLLSSGLQITWTGFSSQGCCLRAAWNPNFQFLVLRRSTSSVVIAVAPLWQVHIQPTIVGLSQLIFSTFLRLLIVLLSPPFLFTSPASTTRSCKDIQKTTNLRKIRKSLLYFLCNLKFTCTSVLIFLPVGDLRKKKKSIRIDLQISVDFWRWQVERCD